MDEEGTVMWNKNLFEHEAHGIEPLGNKDTARRLLWVKLRSKISKKAILVVSAHYTW